MPSSSTMQLGGSFRSSSWTMAIMKAGNLVYNIGLLMLIFVVVHHQHHPVAGQTIPTTAAPYFDETTTTNGATMMMNDRTVYDDWWMSRGSQLYPKNVFLPMVTQPSNGAAVFWTFATTTTTSGEGDSGVAIGRTSSASDIEQTYYTVATNETDATHIQFAVVVQAEGWVGFGISEAGGMLGSDVALFTAANPDVLIDSYIVEDRSMPLTDECQNWDLVSSTIEDGWMIVEMIRPLDTMDTQDHAIIDDSTITTPTRLIAAWGNTETVSYHAFNVGKIATQLYGPAAGGSSTTDDFHALMDVQADGYFDIRETDYTIPTRDTTYQHVCKNYAELQVEFNLPDTTNSSLYFIGAEAILTPETEQYVHHYIVGGGRAQTSCDENYDMMLWGWAPGEEPQSFPPDVGIPMFGPDDQIQSITIQIHYNNPAEVPDQIDSSGMRMYFSTEPRKHEAAWLQLGDPLTLLSGQQIGDGLTKYSFDCDSSCSTAALRGEPVTVITETLHMHQTGARMTNELIRNGEVVNHAKVDVFEFDQQGSFKVPQPQYQIQPGDSFRTTCYYRDGTEFGLSSSEEMCIAFILYYPAKELDFGNFGAFPWLCTVGIDALPVCKEEMEVLSLSTDEELERTFGSPSMQCAGSRTVDAEGDDNNMPDIDGEPGNSTPQGINEGQDATSASFLSSTRVSLTIAIVALCGIAIL